MGIELLKAEDIFLLQPLIQKFFDEGNIWGTFDPEHAARIVRASIQGGTGFVFYQGKPILGAIAAFMYTDFGTGDLCASEFFWYVDKKVRGGSLGLRLFKAFDEEAKKRGAKRTLTMHICTTPENDDKLKHFYESNGYCLKEQVYAKRLN